LTKLGRCSKKIIEEEHASKDESQLIGEAILVAAKAKKEKKAGAGEELAGAAVDML
jgi:hypothetical protein